MTFWLLILVRKFLIVQARRTVLPATRSRRSISNISCRHPRARRWSQALEFLLNHSSGTTEWLRRCSDTRAKGVFGPIPYIVKVERYLFSCLLVDKEFAVFRYKGE